LIALLQSTDRFISNQTIDSLTEATLKFIQLSWASIKNDFDVPQFIANVIIVKKIDAKVKRNEFNKEMIKDLFVQFNERNLNGDYF